MGIFKNRGYIEEINSIPCVAVRESGIERPLFSIVTPTYKRPDDLRNTIRSAIDQSGGFEYEIVVVDNSPERGDETERVISEFDCKNLAYYKNEKNIGMIQNWNRCVTMAKGEWIVYCHDDDILMPDCLLHIDGMIRKNPKARLILGKFEQRDNPFAKESEIKRRTSGTLKIWVKRLMKKILGCLSKPRFPMAACLFLNNVFGPPTCGLSVHRETMLEFGGWDDWGGDWTTMLAFSERYPVVRCRETTGVYIWGKNATLDPKMDKIGRKCRNEIYRMLRKRSKMCEFYWRLLSKDFRKKENSGMTDFSVSYSALYKAISRYYAWFTIG